MRTSVFALILCLSASVSLHAGKKTPQRPILLDTAITLNGAAVPAGVYDVELETSKAGVRVTLWKYGEFVATARGSWMKNGIKFTDNAVLLRVNADGSRALMELRLAGESKSVVIANTERNIRASAK